MRREDFEHLIAAAANILGEPEIAVIGSQAVLGSEQEAPEQMLQSLEADVYPLRQPDRAIEIDGAMGDGSPFHRQYGFYAHGVGPETAQGPEGWEERLVAVEIAARPGSKQPAVAHCMEVHDLVLAKCVASRERDWEFARAAIESGLVEPEELLRRVDDLPIADDHRDSIRGMLRGMGAAG